MDRIVLLGIVNAMKILNRFRARLIRLVCLQNNRNGQRNQNNDDRCVNRNENRRNYYRNNRRNGNLNNQAVIHVREAENAQPANIKIEERQRPVHQLIIESDNLMSD